MNEPIRQQPRIVINGRTLTPEEVGAVVSGLASIARIADTLDEAGGGPVTDLRDARIKKHQAPARALQAEILGPTPAGTGAIVGELRQCPEDATPGRVRITIEVDADRQEAFTQLWHEFLTGVTPQDQAIRARAADEKQGIASLRELAEVAQRDSGQCRRIAAFLAGCYNGPRFPFDLTDLRAIDDELFEHCMAVLRLDHRAKKEVHRYFDDGSELWETRIINAWQLDRAAALHAAYLLAGFLENSETPAFKQLASKIDGWRRDMEPNG